MTMNTLTLPNIATQLNTLFERMMMLQELTRLAIESLPNSTDSDVPAALLNGMKDVLVNDTYTMYQLSEGVACMNDQQPEIAHV